MSAPDEISVRPAADAVGDSTPAVLPIRLAQGKMGALLAAIAGLIVLMFSISQEKSIIEICRSLVTSVLIFGLLGWCSACVLNWHFSSACRRQAKTEREKVAEENDEKDEGESSKEIPIDEDQASPA